VVYLYAVTDRQAAPTGVLGLNESRLRAIPDDRVAVVVSDLEAPVEPTEAALWRHEGVVEELMHHGPVLPMRFGSTVPDEAAARRMLHERGGELSAGLDRVRGAVELGVRVLWEAPTGAQGALVEGEEAAGAGGGAGTTYLMRRLGASRRSHSLADDIHAPLARLARSSTRRLLVTPRLLLSGAYLLEEGATEDFRACVAELDERLEEVAILCTGPWPPYSFVPSGTVR